MKKISCGFVLLLFVACTILCWPTTTNSFSVGPAAFVAVTAKSQCRYILVFEDGQAGTTAIKLKAPTTEDVVVTHPAGQKITLAGNFQPGNTAGWIETVSGTITVDAEEIP